MSEPSGTWVRGEGYTEENPAVRTRSIPIARQLPGPAAWPVVPPRSGERRTHWTHQASRGLTVVIVVLAVVGMVLGLALIARRTSDKLEQDRIDRWEDRLDALDSTSVQLFTPNLTTQQRDALGRRSEHLQRSLCADLLDHLSELPSHLRVAYQEVCEGG